MAGAAFRDLESNPYSDSYRPATVAYGGRVYCDVGARYRGQTSRGYPKHHWKIKFNKDQKFRSAPGKSKVRTVNLSSSYSDKTFVRLLGPREIVAAQARAFDEFAARNGRR